MPFVPALALGSASFTLQLKSQSRSFCVRRRNPATCPGALPAAATLLCASNGDMSSPHGALRLEELETDL